VRLASTPQDYLRFAHMRLNGGELGVRILGRKTVSWGCSSSRPQQMGCEGRMGYILSIQ